MKDKPAVKILILFILGIFTGRYFNFSLPLIYYIALISVLVLIIAFRFKFTGLITLAAIAISLISLSYIKYEFYTGYFPKNHISFFTGNPDPVLITGTVINYPEKRINKTHLTLQLDHLNSKNQLVAVEGRILLTLDNDIEPPQYGDELAVNALIQQPRDRRNPGEFDYREYLHTQGIFGIVNIRQASQITVISSGGGNWFFRNLICPVKKYLDDFIRGHLPEKEAAFLRGLMIGERGEISAEINEAFSKLGVIHILAVSGSNVGFVILIFLGVGGLIRIPYSVRVVLTLLGIIFYTYLTNLNPPVIRASTMGGIILIGTLLERKTNFSNSMALAALIILIAKPLELFQPGFQLSFSAVIAIVYLYPKIKKFVLSKYVFSRASLVPAFRHVLDLLFVSLAAFIGTMPFTLIYFNRLPNFTLIANIFVIPIAFCGLANGIVAVILNLVWPFVADIYMQTAWFCLHWILRLVQWASNLPLAYFEAYRFSGFQFLGYFIGLLLLFNLNFQKTKRWLVIFVLIVLNSVTWYENFKDDAKLEIVFIDVGQGDSILLNFPDGKHALIDAGIKSLTWDTGKNTVLPLLKRMGVDLLDAMILSHSDADHLGGIPHIMRHFKVKEIWDNGQTNDTGLYKDYMHLIDSLHIEHRVLLAGEIIDNFDPVKIFILHPTEDFVKREKRSANDASLSMKISYGDIDILCVGDTEKNGEIYMNQFGSFLQSEVLKVGHHGSNTSSSVDFLNLVKPDFAVISVGINNKFGHPKPEVLERLEKIDAAILRTDLAGAIILTTDGKSIQRKFWK